MKHDIQAGSVFGRLTVIGPVISQARIPRMACTCACGRRITVRRGALTSGNTRSCGCLRREVTRASRLTHGGSGTPEHRAWKEMRSRCSNPRRQFFGRYGGRGITVCDRWTDSFEAFVADMGPRPSPAHSLDRIDVNGNYEPGNCRWATALEQVYNRSVTVAVDAFGMTGTLLEWSALCGLRPAMLRDRLNRGWDAERAIAQPPRRSA